VYFLFFIFLLIEPKPTHWDPVEEVEVEVEVGMWR
jgi:hypothetical protein